MSQPDFLPGQPPPEVNPQEQGFTPEVKKYLDNLRRQRIKGLLKSGIFRGLSPEEIERMTAKL